MDAVRRTHAAGARAARLLRDRAADRRDDDRAELRRYIDELAPSGFNVVPLTVELQKKLAFPFVTVVMTLLAIPFGVSAGNAARSTASASGSCSR